jgi:uncharacterized protein CbrC (UPF0167 family)
MWVRTPLLTLRYPVRIGVLTRELIMERLTISCESCERLWTLGCSLSIYEQQSLETRPCPHCGAYALTAHKPQELVAAAKMPTWTTFAS